jgi:hypothetical protein
MSRYTRYIIVALLLIGALLIWWLPPVRLRTHGDKPTRKPTHRPLATQTAPLATPTPTAPEPLAG